MADASADRVIVLDVVGLQPHHVEAGRTPALRSLLSGTNVTDLRPPFPAVTIPAQTTLATGRSPRAHGDVANGEYDREADEVAFWERDRGDRTRLWELAGDAGLTSGVLFFQHLEGTTADVAVTPSPVEDEANDLLEMDCWTNPDGLYDDLREVYGHFPLHSYWGPGADEESTEWILAAARESVARFDPDLLWVYVPHLDYAGQRAGPGTDAFREELGVVDGLVGEFLSFLEETDRWTETAVAVLSEYGFHAVDRPVFPNRALRRAGLLETDGTGDVDLSESDAFAMVDHQTTHLYADDSALGDARAALADLDGVDASLDEDGKRERRVDHPNAGDVVLVAEADAWFQYYWWNGHEESPPYATDMDIHAKPGFDPCELFLGERGLASLDSSKVGGSHGRVDESAYGCFGLGGPAAPSRPVDGHTNGAVDARAVAPTLADLLDVADGLDADFEVASLLST